VRDRPHALILDFFAGSGTTLHATALLNAADGGRRQCILVTNNEVADRQAQALRDAGERSGSDAWESKGLCRAVTVPRCSAIISGSRQDGSSLDGEWFTGRMVRKQVPRTVRALSFADPARLADPKGRRALATTLGIVQGHLAEAEDWCIAAADTRDPIKYQAVLFKFRALDGFIEALSRSGRHCRQIHLVTAEDRAFMRARHRLIEALPPLIDTVEETREAAPGFPESLAYFRLEYLDPDALEVGAQFTDLLPTLWVLAGAVGPLPSASGDEDYLFPPDARFAVLLKEAAYRRFSQALQTRPDLEWVFLITDSREAFLEMAEQLPSSVPARQRVDRDPSGGVGTRGRSKSPAGLAGSVRRPRRAA
jgi:adenine-specific DNA-methyltransferase